MSFSIKEIFQEAAATIDSRGKEYDPDKGQERSMYRIVKTFNALTEKGLTIEDGWLFMQLVKEVRQQTSPTPHKDSMVDKLAYVLLEMEERYSKLDYAKHGSSSVSSTYYWCKDFTLYSDFTYTCASKELLNYVVMYNKPRNLKALSLGSLDLAMNYLIEWASLTKEPKES